MTRRCLHIGIRTRAEGKRALRAAFARVRHGDLTLQAPGLYFETVEDLRRILTDKRLDLLLEVARNQPESVRALADQLRRNYKNVNADITMLRQLGLIELEERGGRGGPKTPIVPYDEIRVTIALRPEEAVQAA